MSFHSHILIENWLIVCSWLSLCSLSCQPGGGPCKYQSRWQKVMKTNFWWDFFLSWKRYVGNNFWKWSGENSCRHIIPEKRYVPNSKNGRPSEKLCWQGPRCTVSSHIRGERPLHRSDLWLAIAKPWLQIHYMDLLYIVSGDDIMWLPSLDYSLTHGYEMIQKTSSNHDFLEFEMIYNDG